MKNVIKKGLVFSLLGMLLVNLIGFTLNVQAENTTDNVIFSENFDSEVSNEFKEQVTVTNGEAVINGQSTIELGDKAVASNNYEVSFDMKLNSASEIYVHFVGLNGTTGENIFMCERGNGAYWLISDFNGHDVYNNSGDDHGGLNYTPVDLTNFAHVKYVHYEGYVELWVNGVRRVVTHLSNFGNNQYSTRTTLEEGTITKIVFHGIEYNAVVIDNVVVKEALPQSTSYSEVNANVTNTGSKIFPLSAQNLYLDSFKVEATFDVLDNTKTGYYPTVRLFGLNSSLTSNNQRTYSVNIQGYADGTWLTPEIFAQKEGDEPWTGTSGAAIDITGLTKVEYRIEVYGENIVVYINDVKAIETTFETIGITKGHLQYVRVLSGAGGYGWSSFDYKGYSTQTAADITTDKTRIKLGDNATITADLFGIKTNDFAWYVNDVEQAETSTTLELTDLEEGTYKVVYKNGTISSNEIEISVIANLITIVADKVEGYPTDTITVNATLEGDFTTEELKWYVNDVEQAETSETISLTGLEAGEYKVVYKSANTVSNEVIITIVQGNAKITSTKFSYEKTETGEFGLETIGIPEGQEIKWFINDVEVANANTDTLTIEFTDYENGEQLLVHATIGNISTEEVIVTVIYDVLSVVKNTEYFQEVSKIAIEETGSYGTFSVGSDENGTYLYSGKTEGDTYYTVTGTMPSSTKFMMEYKLFVPADISSTYYVYPVAQGLNANSPESFVEIALNVNSNDIDPYLKDQSTGKTYTTSNYGLGKDLTYSTGIAKLGDWNTISFVVDGKNVGMYLNNELVLFFVLAAATVPTSYGFNVYPDGGVGNVPLRIKDIAFSGLVLPAPSINSVSLSVAKVSLDINETTTITASFAPFNAAYEAISWYVNDQLVTGNQLKYTFSSDKAGEYNVHCVIDGVKSAVKTITVNSPVTPEPSGGCGCNSSSLVINLLLSAALITASLAIILKKRS